MFGSEHRHATIGGNFALLLQSRNLQCLIVAETQNIFQMLCFEMMGLRHQAMKTTARIFDWTTPHKRIVLLFHDVISATQPVLWPFLTCILNVLGTVTYIK